MQIKKVLRNLQYILLFCKYFIWQTTRISLRVCNFFYHAHNVKITNSWNNSSSVCLILQGQATAVYVMGPCNLYMYLIGVWSDNVIRYPLWMNCFLATTFLPSLFPCLHKYHHTFGTNWGILPQELNLHYVLSFIWISYIICKKYIAVFTSCM